MLQKCLDYAINYLYRVPKTERDLKVQLMKKGFSESDIENTLIELKRLKYIDDENYVRMYIESELINKGKSQIYIENKLMGKGIEKSLIKKFFSENEEEIEEALIQAIIKEIEKLKKKGFEGIIIIQKLTLKGYLLKYIKKALSKQ